MLTEPYAEWQLPHIYSFDYIYIVLPRNSKEACVPVLTAITEPIAAFHIIIILIDLAKYLNSEGLVQTLVAPLLGAVVQFDFFLGHGKSVSTADPSSRLFILEREHG